MNISALSSHIKANPSGGSKANASKETAEPESLDSYFVADAAMVIGGLGILAAPAVAGAAFGVAGIAAAAAGGAVLDAVVPDSNPSEPHSEFSGAVSLAALAGAGAVLGGPGILATAGVLGVCGVLLSWVDTFGG